MGRFRKSSYTNREFFDGKHRFEHWYRDNTLYFITSRVSDRSPAFGSEAAKAVFRDRFNHYCGRYDFRPIICTLLDNHYHTIGYLKLGENLGPLMQHLHGAVASWSTTRSTCASCPSGARRGTRTISTVACATRRNCVARTDTRCSRRCARDW